MGTASVTLSVLATIKQRERILLRRGRNRLLSLQLIFFASFTSWRLACNRWAELRQSKPIHPLLDLYWYQQNTKFHEKKQGVHFTYYALYVLYTLSITYSSSLHLFYNFIQRCTNLVPNKTTNEVVYLEGFIVVVANIALIENSPFSPSISKANLSCSSRVDLYSIAVGNNEITKPNGLQIHVEARCLHQFAAIVVDDDLLGRNVV